MFHLYIEKQAALLAPYLRDIRSLLDFGCGDLSLAKELKIKLPVLQITGVDVVDSGVRAKDITFIRYDGQTLPFGKNAFDVSIAYHVFHHCSDPRFSFGEASRVTKNRLLIVEPVYRNRVDLFFMKFADRVGNGWRSVGIPMPFTFQTEATWRRFAREFRWNVDVVASAGVLPGWFPVGVTKLFVLTR